MASRMMDEHDRVTYCRAFLRGWCRAEWDAMFRVVEGKRSPRSVMVDGHAAVVVGRDWLASNAIPPEYLEDVRGG